MVKTRSGGATEPLERLATPPKRSRKTRKPIFPSLPKEKEVQEVQEMPEASPEAAVPGTVKAPKDFTTPAWLYSAWTIDKENLTPSIEDTPSKLVSVSVPTPTKRTRDDTEDEPSTSKRARIQNAPTASTKPDMLFMFPKKPASEDEDEDLSAPPRTYAEQIRRDRRAREIVRRNNRLGITPRRKPVRTTGENPFGIETFTAQEKAAQAAQQQSREPSTERHDREERSAAPEPETPRRGLFGSLRDIGSGMLGRIASPFGKTTSPPSATAPQARTEPRRRPTRVWDIQYPEIEPLKDETRAPAGIGEDETDSEKKRQAFEAKHGKTDRKYDHLHTIPLDGNPDNLLYPPKKKMEVTKPTHESLPPATRAAFEQRRQRKERLLGKPPVKEPPAIAPLFGPNSHYARGTKNPMYEQHFMPGPHPAFRKFAGDKRSHDELEPDNSDPEEPSRSGSFQASVEDDQDSTNPAQKEQEQEQEPSTPPTKRQKTNQISHTPRSALKAPGSIGRSGRSARFNDNPIMSIKRMSPIYGSSPAGHYPYHPDNLFHTMEDDRIYAEKQKETGDDTTILSDPSPRTTLNTKLNEKPRHPGDQLSDAMKAAGPQADSPTKPIKYVWRDPNDPDWKPSLENPFPGCYRVPDFDEDEPETEEDESIPDADTPPPPSTPRMSHAELPKASALSTSQSAGALEAANLERRRAEAAKTKPRTSSRLAEVTTARSRSPSPPGLDTDDAGDVSDASIKTPSPTLDIATPNATWTWSADTNEYIASNTSCPDFAYNPHNELVPSFCLKTPSGVYDNTVQGPDNMTEFERQKHYTQMYNDDWAAKEFVFDDPQTYEEAGVGSKYIHDLIRKNDARASEVVAQCDERFAGEWDAHQKAIDAAIGEGRRLVATYPDRDGVDMLDLEEEL